VPAQEGGRPGGPDSGFTLIELLVVMIIIGILAAIAIPVFLSQRAKAQDTATKADLSKLAKEIVTYFIDNTAAPTLVISSGHYQIAGNDAGVRTTGVLFGSTSSSSTTATTTGWTGTAWCVSLTNPAGSTKNYRYSAQNGLESGTCTSPTTP
jgi:type IV pilus assembly protein PilA